MTEISIELPSPKHTYMYIVATSFKISCYWQLRSLSFEAPYHRPIPFRAYRPCNLSETLLFPHHIFCYITSGSLPHQRLV